MSPLNWEEIFSLKAPSLDRERLHRFLNKQSVLVAGAGGSIGQALVAALLDFQPKHLFLVDRSEYGLYQLDRMIRTRNSVSAKVRLILADVASPKALAKVLNEEKIHTLFHLAAYKHVPYCEENPSTVIKNNLGATSSLLQFAGKAKVENFIHVSSDKAVEPLGVMGKTKAQSEQMVALFRKSGLKSYRSVRFGNVLGSSGSFTESLVDSIVTKGPIFITDTRMKRFFISPKAVIDSLLASLLEEAPADVMVPKAQREFPIMKLTERISVRLNNPEAVQNIRPIGIRRGEKLSEKLVGDNEELVSETPFFKAYSFRCLPALEQLMKKVQNEAQLHDTVL